MMAMLRMFCIKTFSFCRAGASPAETGHGNRSGRPTTNEERGICSRTRENQQLRGEDNVVGGPDYNVRSAFGSSFLISHGQKTKRAGISAGPFVLILLDPNLRRQC